MTRNNLPLPPDSDTVPACSARPTVLATEPALCGDVLRVCQPAWMVWTTRGVLALFALGFGVMAWLLRHDFEVGWLAVFWLFAGMAAWTCLHEPTWRVMLEPALLADDQGIYLRLVDASRRPRPEDGWMRVPWGHVGDIRCEQVVGAQGGLVTGVVADLRLNMEERTSIDPGLRFRRGGGSFTALAIHAAMRPRPEDVARHLQHLQATHGPRTARSPGSV